MIHLIHGKDDFRVRRALAAIREALAEADDMLASNTSVLDGATLTPGELLAHATAAPFLASNRMVVVEGLIGHLTSGRPRGRKTPGGEDPLAPWAEAAKHLGDASAIAPTTTLVFVEGAVSPASPAFKLFAAVARTESFAPLGKEGLQPWIGEAAKAKGVSMDGAAVAALAALVGPDLWTVENELAKLEAYAGGETVDRAMVERLVSSAQEAKSWDLTDPLIQGDERRAVTALQRLLEEGEPAPLLAFMVARAYRQLTTAKELIERRAPDAEIARAAGMPEWKVRSFRQLASRYGWDQVRAAYRLLVEADLSVKRGLQDDESALQLLVHELCALAARSGGGRGGYARSAGARSG